jgi:hypothetical protein
MRTAIPVSFRRGAAVEDEPAIEIEAETDAELLVFDVV